jgi:large subunit ribosomal protein L6
MSRVGKRTITIPDSVKISDSPNLLTISGPKGEMKVNLFDGISINISENSLSVSRSNDDKMLRAMHGTIRQLISNAIDGVNDGFSKVLQIQGIGYAARTENNRLVLQLGFSHDIAIDLPDGIEVSVQKNEVEIKGINKQIVGQFAAKVRSLKKPEPYKGKGIRYKGEYVRSKQGKKVGGKD